MAEVVLGAVSIVSGCLVAPVNRLCGYVISYDSHVRKLKAKVAELGHARQEVQDSINVAENNVKPIKADVNEWMEDVKKDTEEAQHVLDDDERAKKTCFYKWLPKVRYRLGREARRKAERIQGLIDLKPSGEVYDDPPPGLVDGTCDVISSAGDRGDTIFDSQASILEGIMNALDDEEHKVVGVYGPGGVGKTTLLEEVEKKLRKEGRPFGMIVKSKVSQTPDLREIQFNIAYALGLKDLKDEPSEEGRRDLLFKRLQKDPSEKILIILDDLWKEVNLRAVGIPLGDESRGNQVLLTSRYKNVLEQMKCAPYIFHLEGLKNDEAFRLFEKTVGDRLKDNGQLKTIVDKVVKKLAGLPLLIISVASFLKDKDECAWRNAQIEIDESNKEKKETIVKLSYNHLKSEDAKTLFLLCGLIGGTIQVETLLVLGMGLGLFEEFRRTVQDSRDRLNTILEELRSACLLLDGGDDKNNVTIHDLYSEVVVSTSFRGQNSLMMNSNYGSWSKEKLEKCWAICLADVDKKRLDELMKCQFPDLKILMLSQSEGWRWKQEHEREVGDCSGLLDFTYMKELRVLYFHSMHIASLPPSIGILGNLHSLYLVHCDVQDVTVLGKLKALQILTFTQSTISRLPKEIGELTNLRSLNLIKCYNLETIEPGVLNRLTNLEELHIDDFSQWMGKDQIPSESCNARLAELKSLTQLSALAIWIPNPTMLLKDGDLPFGNLDRFDINIGNFQWVYEGLTIMNLNLEGCDSILSRKWVEKNLQKTQFLHLSKLSEFKESPRELCTQGFREVKDLRIRDSPSIKYIVDSSKGLPLTAFGKLEYFFLENLINLEKICHGPIALECFKKLKAVRVKQCDQLKYLWCLSDVQRLEQLEKIKVWKCDSMQSIVTHDAGEDIASTNNKVELPNVRRLVLKELPNMTSFCTKAEITSEDIPIQVSLPRLESLVMVGLLGLEKILYSEPSLKYSNLKSLEIEESKSTSIILKDWILKLPNLELMKIVGTPSVEVVFDLEELKVIKEVEILSRLSTLELSKLPNLRCMWKQDVQVQGIPILQNLKKLFINNTGLSFLFPLSVAKCLREIREIEVEDCPNMKAVIVDEEGRDDGTDDIIEFPLLERLSISCCPTEKFFSYPHGKKESIAATSNSKDAYFDSFFDQNISLPGLKALILNSLGSFKSIWHNELHKSYSDKLANLTLKQDLQSQGILIFQNLKVLSINNIGLSFLFPLSMAKCLREIREIKVEDCPNMKAVFVDEEGRDDGTDDIIEFPLLEQLSISCCPIEKFFSYPHGKKESIATTSDSKDAYSNSFFDQKISLPGLEKLRLELVGSLKRLWHGELPKSSFDKLAKLTLEKCSNLLDVFPSTIMGRLHNLNIVKVSKCPSLKTLFDFGSLDSQTEQTIVLLPELEEIKVLSCPSLESLFNWAPLDSSMKHKIVLFPMLGEVHVNGAGQLKHVVMSDSQTVLGFPSLGKVFVRNCSELRYLFPNYTATTLGKLDILVISKCKQMKEVVPKEEGGRSKAEVMSFPSLYILCIWQCPNLRAFIWSPTSVDRQLGEMIEENDELPRPFFNDMVRFPDLEMLYIRGVQCKELWNNQISDDSFCKLESLLLKDCDNLQHIAPSHMWKRLQDCLETLEVKSCRSIEIIYESDGTVAKCNNLSTLDLRDLDKLRHIWRYDNLPNIPFPNLKYIKAMRCSRLDMLFTTFTAKFLEQIEKLVVGSCEDMELIAGHEECEEPTGKTITFSGLTTLRLYNLPKFRSFLPEKYSRAFPSLDVSSRIEPHQGNQSAEESEGESEQLDREIEEFDNEIEGQSEGE